MSSERLQKILAQAGIASRRKAEELIEMGEVSVNGKVAKLGDRATMGVDHIKVSGKLLLEKEDHVYVAFHKPKGVISLINDPDGRPALGEYLVKVTQRIFPIGRLDFNDEGILLLTNDGMLAEGIQKNPKFPRVYAVKLKGHMTSEMVQRLERGAKIGNRFVKPHSVRIVEELNKKTKVEIVFLGSANVDVKGYFEDKGFLVEKVVRTAFGHITLKGLEVGEYRVVPKSKLEALILQPELGVRDIQQRHEKQKAVLPTDLRDPGIPVNVKRNALKSKIVVRTPSESATGAKPRPAYGKNRSIITPDSERESRGGDRGPRRDSRGPSKFGRSSERTERSDRAPRGERSERTPRSFSGDRSERAPRSFGGERSERAPRAPRGERSERAPRSFGGERSERGERRPFQKREGSAGPGFGNRARFNDRGGEGRSERSGSGSRGGFGGARRDSREGGFSPRGGAGRRDSGSSASRSSRGTGRTTLTRVKRRDSGSSDE